MEKINPSDLQRKQKISDGRVSFLQGQNIFKTKAAMIIHTNY